MIDVQGFPGKGSQVNLQLHDQQQLDTAQSKLAEEIIYRRTVKSNVQPARKPAVSQLSNRNQAEDVGVWRHAICQFLIVNHSAVCRFNHHEMAGCTPLSLIAIFDVLPSLATYVSIRVWFPLVEPCFQPVLTLSCSNLLVFQVDSR